MVMSGEPGEQLSASERRRRMMWRNRPPENEVPGALALDRVLGRTDDLAVILVGGRVYSNGIDLNVLVLQHTVADAADDGDAAEDALYEQVFADEASSASGTALLLGVEFSDGRTTTNLRFGRHTFSDGSGDDRDVCLMSAGGGGGRGNVRMRFWLTPQPPAGDLLVVCAWPHRGIGETRTVVSAADLNRARAHCTELWPWEPEPDRKQRPPSAPPVLPPGWFTDAWRSQEQS